MELQEEMRLQARALADTSRFRLLQHLIESEAPVDVAELTDLLGFNHNAIRQHLAVMAEAGLISESEAPPTGRGRPRKLYTVRRDALSAFRSVSGSYQRLAELLLRLATSDADPYSVGFAAASEGPILGSPDPDAARSTLTNELSVEGFEPVTHGNTTVLGHCPFADVAAENPGVICEIHRGLINGHLAKVDPTVSAELVPKDPHRAGCKVKIRIES